MTGAQRMYLAMERLSGETLAERLARAELTLAAWFSLGARIASALGVVHREGAISPWADETARGFRVATAAAAPAWSRWLCRG